MDLDLSAELRSDILQWNVRAWSSALCFWNSKLNQDPYGEAYCLELGARDGGLSLFLALKGFRIVCTDVRDDFERAQKLHKKYSVLDRIDYRQVDATQIPYPDDTFDIVAFKSMLGGIAYAKGLDSQQKVICEIVRVLKPGGCMIFAENLAGSRLHSFMRNKFIKNRGPDNTWRYPSLNEMRDSLELFEKQETECFSLLSQFGRSEKQKSLLSYVDSLFDPVLPDRVKTIFYGYCKK